MVEKNLNYLNISSFNTNIVNNISNMFSGNSNLESLDLSFFNTSNVIKKDSLFSD